MSLRLKSDTCIPYEALKMETRNRETKIWCKFHTSSSGCRAGDTCLFYHDKRNVSRTSSSSSSSSSSAAAAVAVVVAVAVAAVAAPPPHEEGINIRFQRNYDTYIVSHSVDITTEHDIRWKIKENLPATENEIAMIPYLIRSKREAGRGIDLPEARRTAIEDAGEANNLSLVGSMSLRRQIIREMASRNQSVNPHTAFYVGRDMGDPSLANIHAARFESYVAAYLDSKGVKYLREDDLTKMHAVATPDFLLVGKYIINGKIVRWIDCKTYYGSSMLAGNASIPIGKLKKQSDRYNALYGNGAFCFLCGFSCDLYEAARFGEDVLLLDTYDITGIDSIWDE